MTVSFYNMDNGQHGTPYGQLTGPYDEQGGTYAAGSIFQAHLVRFFTGQKLVERVVFVE